MSLTKTLSAVLLATACSAQTQADIEAYPDYAEQFAIEGITWEPVKVKTEDGWTLTVFHITGDADGPYQVTKPSVVMQHGMGGSGILWTGTYGGMKKRNTVPMAYQLAKDGYDVWITNNSAVQYSQEHDTWTPFDKEYWTMDWRKYALYDFPALVAEIRTRNGDKKVTYVGHSQGTT